MTSVKSFKIAQTLFQSLEAKNKEIPVILIGEYSSLSGDEPAPRLVPTTDGENFARSKGLKFLECSSLENSNVDEAFSTLAHDAVEVLEPELVEQYVQYLAELRTATMGILVNNRITSEGEFPLELAQIIGGYLSSPSSFSSSKDSKSRA